MSEIDNTEELYLPTWVVPVSPHAEICPVCVGKGVVYGIAETGACPTETCHGCNGKGWVTVS